MSATPAAAPATPAPTNAPYASASLYVGDLVPDVNEAFLFDLFNAVGPVASVRICRDAATRRSLGYGYVNFHRAEDAERALENLNFKQIRGKQCRIMWSIRDPALRRSGQGNIFVLGLDKSVDNKSLWDTFSLIGNILSCKVVTNNKGESLGYGFVHFAEEEAATAAIEKVNGKMVGGSVVTVQPFKSKKERGAGNASTFTNVFVKNLAPESTKEQVDELFGKYGRITSSVVTVDATKTRAFGFVNFETHEQASAAIEGLNNFEFQGRKLFVGRAQKKEEREREFKDRSEQVRAERLKKYQGVNLYVKNLADTVDDDKLRSEFSAYGTITSAKIMRDEKGNTRGFGFVCFSSPEEATRAVTEMSNKMVDQKPLYVALHQRKEQRRAMMEAHRAQHMRNMPMQPPMMYAPQGMMFPPFRQPMMFPPNMGRFPGNRFPPHMAPQMRFSPNFQLMPVQQQQRQPLPNGARGPQQRGGPHQPRQPRPQQAGQAGGIKYGDNVRNRPQQVTGNMVAPADAVPSTPAKPLSPNEPLTSDALSSAPEEMRKQMIGERLFPLIKEQQPELAGKITGMLLELENFELLHLLDSHEALSEKVKEAIIVLEQHDDNN